MYAMLVLVCILKTFASKISICNILILSVVRASVAFVVVPFRYYFIGSFGQLVLALIRVGRLTQNVSSQGLDDHGILESD